MRIGVTGYAQHGKDSTGKVLSRLNFKRYAFADQLKELALYINPLIPEQMQPGGRWENVRLADLVERWGWERAKMNSETRRFLQELGTGVRKIIGADAWVAALEARIEEDRAWNGDIVVTDVRFMNEFEWVKSNGGTMWRVARLNEDGTAYDNGIGTEHESEQWVDKMPVDRVLRAHTLGDLKNQVLDALGGMSEEDIARWETNGGS